LRTPHFEQKGPAVRPIPSTRRTFRAVRLRANAAFSVMGLLGKVVDSGDMMDLADSVVRD
jgi:hypothetical protein